MTTSVNRAKHTNLAVIQVDGLSLKQLEKAFDQDLMPNLKERVDDGTLLLDSYRTGLPSQTTVAIGGLMYGKLLPGNQWYDKDKKAVVDTFDFGDAPAVDDHLSKTGQAIAKGGSVYLSPIGGGATADESHFVFSDLGRAMQAEGSKGLLKTGLGEFAKVMKHLVVHPAKAIQSALHFGSELAHDLRNRKTTGRDLKTMVIDAFKETLAVDASSQRIADQIREGKAPYLYVDLANFDAKNHSWGPGEEAFNSLPMVDRNLDTILDAVEESKTSYNIAILADHGSARSYHFHDLYGESVQQVSQKLAPEHRILSLDFGSGAHIYLIDQPGALSRSELPEKLVSGLREQPGIAFTVTREGKATVIEGRQGSVTVENGEVTESGQNPIAAFEDETELVARQLHDLAHREKTGDILVFGEHHKDGLVDFSTSAFRGLHGGIGLDQTKPFIAWNPQLEINTKIATDSTVLHQQFLRSMRA